MHHHIINQFQLQKLHGNYCARARVKKATRAARLGMSVLQKYVSVPHISRVATFFAHFSKVRMSHIFST